MGPIVVTVFGELDFYSEGLEAFSGAWQYFKEV
jgi:hypothetical protein